MALISPVVNAADSDEVLGKKFSPELQRASASGDMDPSTGLFGVVWARLDGETWVSAKPGEPGATRVWIG
jgi:hypothetical protein